MSAGFAASVVFLVALFATLTATEMVRAFAYRLRAIDAPGGRRVHRRPTARLGGLGIFWGVAVALLLATWAAPGRSPLAGQEGGVLGMLAGAGLLLVVGMIDDVRGLRATSKLGFQIVAGAVLWVSGWRFETLGIPGMGAWDVRAWSLPLTLGWVVVVTNAVNLVDGLDGLACGLGLVAATALCALAGPEHRALLVAAAALAGALCGFLWFNLHPALIFMGDAGSLFLGYVLAALTLRAGQVVSPEAAPAVLALVLAVPLFDILDAVRRRLASAWVAGGARGFAGEARRRLFAPDGMHVHHRLTRAGLSTRRAVGWLWLVAALLAIAAWVLARDPWLGALAIAAAGALLTRAWTRIRAGLARATPVADPAEPARDGAATRRVA